MGGGDKEIKIKEIQTEEISFLRGTAGHTRIDKK